jgi:hypothetical protein
MTDRPCSIDGCAKPAKCRGWCSTHYQRWRTHGDPTALVCPHGFDNAGRLCAVEGCDRPARSRERCDRHYRQLLAQLAPSEIGHQPRRPLVACAVEGCDRDTAARGWCATHYTRWLRTGSPTGTARPPRRLCSIEGCDRPHKGRGLCACHLRRLKLHGDADRALPGGGIYPDGAGWVYVVTDDDRTTVKLGITSMAKPAARFRDHRRDGLPVVLRVWELGEGQAPAALRIEADALGLLDLAGWEPKRGREYFDGAATADVLAVLDALVARHQAEVDR